MNWKNTFYFKYEGPTNDVNFNEYYDQKHLLNGIKNQSIKFDDALKKQKDLLKQINEVKIHENTPKQKDVINNLENFYNSREEVRNFFRDYTEIVFDAGYKEKHGCFKSSCTSKSRQ